MRELYRLKNLKRVRCIRCGRMVWQDDGSGAILGASNGNRCDHTVMNPENGKGSGPFPMARPYPVPDSRPAIGMEE